MLIRWHCTYTHTTSITSHSELKQQLILLLKSLTFMLLLKRRAVIRNSIRRSHAATAMRDVCLDGNLVVLNLRIRFCHSVEKQASCTLNKIYFFKLNF